MRTTTNRPYVCIQLQTTGNVARKTVVQLSQTADLGPLAVESPSPQEHHALVGGKIFTPSLQQRCLRRRTYVCTCTGMHAFTRPELVPGAFRRRPRAQNTHARVHCWSCNFIRRRDSYLPESKNNTFVRGVHGDKATRKQTDEREYSSSRRCRSDVTFLTVHFASLFRGFHEAVY